jgi:hypothetical protein
MARTTLRAGVDAAAGTAARARAQHSAGELVVMAAADDVDDPAFVQIW